MNDPINRALVVMVASGAIFGITLYMLVSEIVQAVFDAFRFRKRQPRTIPLHTFLDRARANSQK